MGRAAFGRAFQAAYGTDYPDLAALNFVGATDSRIIRAMTRECNLENSPAREEHFYLCLACEVDQALMQSTPLVYPGVAELLAVLHQQNYKIGMVTGNIRATAWSKLRHAGLDYAFSYGAFGDEHHERTEIARLALQRAEAHTGVLIGDTPEDIEAAHANGLKAVAVATGWVPAEELVAAGADLVLPDFKDTTSTVQQLQKLLCKT